MKASTPDLMKFKRLQRRLGTTRLVTIGLLESLWLATAKNCPDGGIGRFTNEEIAIMVDWQGDHEDLISALVDSDWLDPCTVNRLVVHDWSDHCPSYIEGILARHKKTFAIAAYPEEVPKGAYYRRLPKDPTSYPILSNPIQFPASAGESTCVDAPPSGQVAIFEPELMRLCEWWNDLREEQVVAAAVSTSRISEELKKGWERYKRYKEVRDCLADLDAMSDAIRASEFCREPWFTLAKLLGAKNRHRELIARNVLEGRYMDTSRSKKPQTPSGSRYDVADAG